MLHESQFDSAQTQLATDQQLQDLQDKHAALEIALSEEERRPLPNSLEISRLKREKLAIKDEIARLKHY